MADKIQRATFYEGQTLGAIDLNVAVQHDRDQQARHERYLHTWGIAHGLELKDEKKTDSGGNEYVEITLSEGVAIDVSGREIVVAEETRLSEARFDELAVESPVPGPNGEPTEWYPVFLRGFDEVNTAIASLIGSCSSTEPTRTTESYEVVFGRPGDASANPPEPPDEVVAGPGGGIQVGDARHVLLGFVRWKGAPLKKFIDLAFSDEGVTRRFAGALADEVTARSGVLSLSSGATEERTKRVGVAIDAAEGTLVFGPQDENGSINPAVMTVKSNGDLSVLGTVTSPVSAEVFVASGVASDGVVLPLPNGVTQSQVDDGQMALHIHVTPRLEGVSPSGAVPVGIPLPVECRVDNDRRVHCRFAWFFLGYYPGACDYTVLAYAAGESGGTS